MYFPDTHSPESIYDCLVVGGGHAGCEAAAAAARSDAHTILVTSNLDTIGAMSCNPAIGGIGKGHLVREIDAFNGVMPQAADLSSIHFRMLNQRKGPAVWGPRSQIDRTLYQDAMQNILKLYPNLCVLQANVTNIIVDDSIPIPQVVGIQVDENTIIKARTVVLTTGTFLGGTLFCGTEKWSGGRLHDKALNHLQLFMKQYNFPLARLKTGTPPRLLKNSLNLDNTSIQLPQLPPVPFSIISPHDTDAHNTCPQTPCPQVPCHITWTNERTHQLVQQNLHLSPLYSGSIQSTGPRYCPSLEDKIVRFHDKDKHRIFLEPEGLNLNTVYPNGLSNCLPENIQLQIVRSLDGLQQAQMTQPGYAVEYDFVNPKALLHSLETKLVKNLFLAGQINGSTGYEEAAAQGLMAGINAARKALLSKNYSPIVLSRSQAYIGVLIDDLVRKGVTEPYRMFTARAEYRLMLRPDNSNFRLFDIASKLNVLSSQYIHTFSKQLQLSQQLDLLLQQSIVYKQQRISLLQVSTHPDVTLSELQEMSPQLASFPSSLLSMKLNDALYHNYQQRLNKEIYAQQQDSQLVLPPSLNYFEISGLSNELAQKLSAQQPQNLANAASIEGMTPAALHLLLRFCKKHPSPAPLP